jgi:hypothetical protein
MEGLKRWSFYLYWIGGGLNGTVGVGIETTLVSGLDIWERLLYEVY